MFYTVTVLRLTNGPSDISGKPLKFDEYIVKASSEAEAEDITIREFRGLCSVVSVTKEGK